MFQSTAAHPARAVRYGANSGTELLNRIDNNLRDGASPFEQLEEFCIDLLHLRAELGPDWEAFAKQQFHNHPLRARIHTSPLSARCYAQPRGYPGDAVMLDYIYGLQPPGNISAFGRAVFGWEYQTRGCRSVRERRQILARLIDDVAAARPDSRMLSVACGHLREAELSSALRDGGVADFVALDQDAESLAAVARNWRDSSVRPVNGSVRSILNGKSSFRELDLVYSAGLYDYLPDALAARLTARMFDMLRPGGRLLVANFHPNLPDKGGMEMMLRWWLIYRDEEQVASFADEIDPALIASRKVYLDSHRNVAYLELIRG